MNSREYIEYEFELMPFSEANAELLIALIEDLPFESFVVDDSCLKAYVQKEEELGLDLNEYLSQFDLEFKISFSFEDVPSENWNAAWESQFEPIVVDDICTIKASFHKGLKETKYTITIDPKMAFGTGHHQTTYMMCRHIVKNEDLIVGKTIMDMGCGTGILAILAAMVGAEKAYGIDIDSVAAESAVENASVNMVSIETFCGDASDLMENSYDVMLANINRNILIQDMEFYSRAIRENGFLFVSGFYVEDMAMICAVAENYGFKFVSSDNINNWASIKFAKRA